MRDSRGTEMNSSPRISCQSAWTGVILVKKRWPPMSKRKPLYCAGARDAADDVVASSTVVFTPALASR